VDVDDSSESIAVRLRAGGLAPRKRLGQNFLRDRSYLRRIVDAAEVQATDEVLEIGAGTGVLTRALVERARRVIALELDDSLFTLLQHDLADIPNLDIRHGNALDFDPSAHFSGSYKLVGNIPYYITGPLVRRYLEIKPQPAILVFMVQREVAERIVAQPGNLSVLGVSVQFYAAASIVARVPAGAFYPVPKVDSAILKLVPKAGPLGGEPDAFFRVVKAGFSMRRKQLGNSIAAGLNLPRAAAHALLTAASIDEKRRAETLSIEEWITLTKVVTAASPQSEV
jgi:16S rRNA (adenine1518-N6/adenine1519-N6)-dimethyltransferase